MSYVNIPPAYYASNTPDSIYRPGAPGWLQANVDGWGENPNQSWAADQAVNGLKGGVLGDAAAKPSCTPGPCPAPPRPFFTYYNAAAPFNHHIPVATAPWGSFPRGPAYAVPRPRLCPTCTGGMGIKRGVGGIVEASRAINVGDLRTAAELATRGAAGLGADGCGPCQISAGDRCLPCPDTSDLPECQGCSNGQPIPASTPWYEHPLAGPIAVGVATTVATGIVMAFLAKKKVVAVV